MAETPRCVSGEGFCGCSPRHQPSSLKNLSSPFISPQETRGAEKKKRRGFFQGSDLIIACFTLHVVEKCDHSWPSNFFRLKSNLLELNHQTRISIFYILASLTARGRWQREARVGEIARKREVGRPIGEIQRKNSTGVRAADALSCGGMMILGMVLDLPFPSPPAGTRAWSALYIRWIGSSSPNPHPPPSSSTSRLPPPH